MRVLFGLGILGGAATGVAFPTKGAVESILNKQEMRRSGGNTKAGQDYENYGYGNGGFGDLRTKKVTNGNWSQEFNTALSNIRKSGGKQNVGKGLEKGFKNGLENKQNICKNGGSSSNDCFVGNIEFVDSKGETLFGRIPVKDSSGNHNLYVRGHKCKDKAAASAIGRGRKKSQSNGSAATSSGSTQTRNYNGCFDSSASRKK